MLFNSPEFIFLFLPVTTLGFFVLGGLGRVREGLGWLVLASLFFYGWWNPAYLPLILASIAFNLLSGRAIYGARRPGRRKALLAGSIGVNLALLGYFKYWNFIVDNLNAAFGWQVQSDPIVLPLGISFFTFTQIAFLVDVHQNAARDFHPMRYALFVTYFPHLIAGPILHHGQMMPQFADPAVYRPRADNIAWGLSLFAIGLFKKVVLADNVAVYARPVFAASDAGDALNLLEAWGGVMAYTLQLYFDFSGYSDMAVGCAKMLGIDIPINFNSPYKARSIVEFWRRWHMTLSQFLRDYLYIPLGGNRRGPVRRYANLLITMLLGGLWHGAGWTFVIWGGLHGGYLVANHAWSAAVRGSGLLQRFWSGRTAAALGWGCTFAAVVLAWVFFRSETLAGAWNLLGSMAGVHGLVIPAGVPAAWLHGALGAQSGEWVHFPVAGVGWVGALTVIALALPNSMEYMSRTWRPAWPHAVLIAALAFAALGSLHQKSEFLYFQF